VTAVAQRPLVILGKGELAQLAHYYYTHDSQRSVAGFTVDAKYVEGTQYIDLPLVPYEQLAQHFPPADYDLFVAIGYTNLNAVRAERCRQAREQGYKLASYVSSRASVWTGMQIGGNSLIMEGNFIQPYASLGEGVIMFCGSVVSHHCSIGDHCFIGSGAIICGGVRIGERSFIGANATVREHLTVGRDCIVGAGAMVLKDTLDGSGYLSVSTPDSGIPSRRLRSLL